MSSNITHDSEHQRARALVPKYDLDPNGLMRAPGYTHEQIEHALVTLALHGGDLSATARKLRAEGGCYERIVYGTLKNWTQRFHERYEEIYEREIVKIQKRVAMRAEEALVEAVQATHEGVEHSRKVLFKLAPKDVAGHARNMAVVAGLMNDKIIGPNRGRPQQIIEVRREPTEIMAELKSMFPGVIEGSAVEIIETRNGEGPAEAEPSPASEPEGPTEKP